MSIGYHIANLFGWKEDAYIDIISLLCYRKSLRDPLYEHYFNNKHTSDFEYGNFLCSYIRYLCDDSMEEFYIIERNDITEFMSKSQDYIISSVPKYNKKNCYKSTDMVRIKTNKRYYKTDNIDKIHKLTNPNYPNTVINKTNQTISYVPDTLKLIIKLLNKTDIQSMLCVCKNWNSLSKEIDWKKTKKYYSYITTFKNNNPQNNSKYPNIALNNTSISYTDDILKLIFNLLNETDIRSMLCVCKEFKRFSGKIDWNNTQKYHIYGKLNSSFLIIYQNRSKNVKIYELLSNIK